MFDLGLLKNLKQKGAMFIEYAMALAFVVVVGVVFISDGSIKNSIASIFGKTGDSLEVAVKGGEKQKANTLSNFMNFISNNHTDLFRDNGGQTLGAVIRSSDDVSFLSDTKGLDNWVFANNHSWNMTWTGVDLTNVEDGTLVKAVMYDYNSQKYSVGYAFVKDHQIQTTAKSEGGSIPEYYSYNGGNNLGTKDDIVKIQQKYDSFEETIAKWW